MKHPPVSTSFSSSLLAGALAVGAATSGYQACAQNSQLDLIVNVPFDFRSGSESMPAGRYQIQELSEHYLLLRKSDQPRSQMLPTSIAEAPTTPNHSSLVFHRYGKRYFIHQIWLRGSTQGFEVHRSHAEQEILRAKRATLAAESELALNEPLHR